MQNKPGVEKLVDKNKLRKAIKEKDGWWASLFSGPLANRLLEPIVDIKWISPNLITVCSFLIGCLAAWCFAIGNHEHLIYGAILVQLSFVVDCMDGQLARYRKQFSNLGAWLDRISDRVKDFLYFFSLAWGFHFTHGEEFHLGFNAINNLLAKFLGEEVFLLSPDLQAALMKSITLPSWIIWPLAMTAVYAVFLIDYYVNQDMKLEARHCNPEHNKRETIQKNSGILKSILNLGLSIYKAVPILRFNIGEQALLISLFTAFNSVFLLICLFALLGSFYCLVWPVMKIYGFSPEK